MKAAEHARRRNEGLGMQVAGRPKSNAGLNRADLPAGCSTAPANAALARKFYAPVNRPQSPTVSVGTRFDAYA